MKITIPSPLEKDIENKVVKYARSLGWLVYKFTSPAQRSVPDRLFMRNGVVLFIEFKRKGEKATPKQGHEAKVIYKQGGVPVVLVDDVAYGKFIVDEFSA